MLLTKPPEQDNERRNGWVFKDKSAPANLEVPPHKYLTASKSLIGEDDAA